MTEIIFEKNGQAVLKRAIDNATLTIGRDPASDIQLLDPEISRLHCTLEKQNGHFILKDSSRNGTFVNDHRVFQATLKTADRIQIGSWRLKLIEPLSNTQTAEETVVQCKSVKKEEGLSNMLGKSPVMQKVFEKIRKAAAGDVSVFLVGQSGTGKELAARSLHDLGARKEKPFVAVNCGAIPENLIESVLFGHEKGSFTGASDRHTGVFEEAHTGTLFLDEIGEMPLDLQTRLLRVLETQTLRRVGGKQDIKVDVRLVAATNKDLQREVAQGKFRQDLFFRLYIFPIELPPLKSRGHDIEMLTAHFLKLFAPPQKTFSVSEGAMQKIRHHEWPGNVRELKNALQRAILLAAAETIESEDLDISFLSQQVHAIGELELDEQERISIIEALRKTRGVKAHAAKHLGIARTSLASKLRRYKIDPKLV
ncbi:MAG: sigma 54-interacting transcriptional regulator [Deltaproteobacteria bacterium]|nr:sigma 54-interacting transcriptional regulator [Deltaproteobacteria bacterium]